MFPFTIDQFFGVFEQYNQAIMWLVFGVIRPKLSFQLHTNPYALIGIFLIVYAMLV